jgi:hypothetical protein
MARQHKLLSTMSPEKKRRFLNADEEAAGNRFRPDDVVV